MQDPTEEASQQALLNVLLWAGWPPVLIRALNRKSAYVGGLRDGTKFTFYCAERVEQDMFVKLKNGSLQPSGERLVVEKPNSFDVRVSEIIWIAECGDV